MNREMYRGDPQRYPQAQGQQGPQPHGQQGAPRGAQEGSVYGRTQAQPMQGGERTRTRPVFVPPVDIYETPDAIVLLAEMPGVDPQSVDITLERGLLTVRGSVPEVPHGGYRQIYAEYSDGDYERAFTLSEHVDQDRIEASVNNGLVQLVLPKAAPAKARKIQLKTG